MSKIRNTIIGATAVVAPLVLIGSSAGAAQLPKSLQKIHPVYDRALKHIDPSLKQYSNRALSTVGNVICYGLRQGNSVDFVVQTMASDLPLSGYQDGEVLAASTVFICPAYRGEVQAWANANGGNSGNTGNSGSVNT